MRIYSGEEKCLYCGHSFTWEYCDDGHFRSRKPYYTPALDVEPKSGVVQCNAQVLIPKVSVSFVGHCPNCQADFSIQCNERILEELYT